MLKNITLSADEVLIKKARKKAMIRKTTVNNEFRVWLKKYAENESNSSAYNSLMKKLEQVDSGGSYSRDELNER
ncbi:MAG: hypothetical protein D8M58_15150 [Calditrichaeota bacterium]|nr:MAG: hypothetical protein DWQ03_16390 [Calditrichota bacterium]MBL1206741.1 hypothetical protein [Calditrichota bacterium]NOG46567.1 hypothetical protein [Calditrichota bacterium]